MGEGVLGESWHCGLRARVTALKCHVMASQGLTPEGLVVPAYNPQVCANCVRYCILTHYKFGETFDGTSFIFLNKLLNVK